jgi:hypothetical protein
MNVPYDCAVGRNTLYFPHVSQNITVHTLHWTLTIKLILFILLPPSQHNTGFGDTIEWIIITCNVEGMSNFFSY